MHLLESLYEIDIHAQVYTCSNTLTTICAKLICKYIQTIYIASSKLKQPLQRWLEVEHEALLYAYSIMRHRSETNGTLFSWAPISQVITNREPSTCRRRISHLKETWPRFNDHIELLKRKWAIIYAHGIATGELVDSRPWDWRNYDILGQLEYFVTKLKQDLHEWYVFCLCTCSFYSVFSVFFSKGNGD